MAFTLDSGTYGAEFPVKALAASNLRIITGQIDFDSSYPTGGEAMDLSSYFPVALKAVFIENKAGYVFAYDYANKKVLAYYADYDAVADGALIQVANTTDLSAVVDVRFMAIGY